MKALVLQVLCFTSVAFSPMQQRNNGPLLRFLFSGILGSLCLFFVSDFLCFLLKACVGYIFASLM